MSDLKIENLVKKWKIPSAKYRQLIIKNGYIIVVGKHKIIYTNFNEWERL
jgi:CDP-glycerol glycerophosphotransferase (TagB/SpsB family)